jgi:DinB superfamily
MLSNDLISDPGLIRLIQAARGLEAGGFYNAAKLFWALIYSTEVRASNQLGLPANPDELDDVIEGAIQGLLSQGVNPDIVYALQHGREAARANRAIPASEIPPVFVCRSCGEIILGEAPDQCPNCGAWELTFREIPPIYYLEPLHPLVVMEALEAAPQVVESAVHDLTEAQMAQAPRPGEWGIRDVLYHLLVTQLLLNGRVERMLAENNPSLKGVASWAAENQASLSATSMLDQYRLSRQATLNLLRQMPVESWWRTAEHEEFGSVTLLQQASYFAKHERSHLPKIAAIRKLMDGS